jgi:hypothetical protein
MSFPHSAKTVVTAYRKHHGSEQCLGIAEYLSAACMLADVLDLPARPCLGTGPGVQLGLWDGRAAPLGTLLGKPAGTLRGCLGLCVCCYSYQNCPSWCPRQIASYSP